MSDLCCDEKLKATSSSANSDSAKCKIYANVGFLTVAVIGVWVLFSVPVILSSTRPVENVSQ